MATKTIVLYPLQNGDLKDGKLYIRFKGWECEHADTVHDAKSDGEITLCEECCDLLDEGAIYTTQDGKPFSPDTKDGLRLWDRYANVGCNKLLAPLQDVAIVVGGTDGKTRR